MISRTTTPVTFISIIVVAATALITATDCQLQRTAATMTSSATTVIIVRLLVAALVIPVCISFLLVLVFRHLLVLELCRPVTLDIIAGFVGVHGLF